MNNPTRRTYQVTIYEVHADESEEIVPKIAKAARVQEIAAKDSDKSPADGSDEHGLLACFLDATDLRCGPADLIRDGAFFASMTIERLSHGTAGYLRGKCTPSVKVRVGDEIVQYDDLPEVTST